MSRTDGVRSRSVRVAGGGGETVAVARRLIGDIEALAAEVRALTVENGYLHEELAIAVEIIERAGEAIARVPGADGAGRARSRAGVRGHSQPPRPAAHPREARRVTPTDVTSEVVRAAIEKLGRPTAREIAAEVSATTGTEVSGRAMRFLAEGLGAVGESDGAERRYSL